MWVKLICVFLLQVKQAMSSSQSVAVSVPNPLPATSLPSSDSSGKPAASSEGSQNTTSQQQQQQQQQSKAHQLSAAALKQVKLTTLKRPPGIDPVAVMKERECR